MHYDVIIFSSKKWSESCSSAGEYRKHSLTEFWRDEADSYRSIEIQVPMVYSKMDQYQVRLPGKSTCIVLKSSSYHNPLTHSLSLSVPGQCRTLLHNICHLSIKAFKTDAVTMATHCWTWLIIARPDLEYSVSTNTHVSIHYTLLYN